MDLLLSNRGIDVYALLVHWVPYVVGKRDSITVAMDWTEFDASGSPEMRRDRETTRRKEIHRSAQR